MKKMKVTLVELNMEVALAKMLGGNFLSFRMHHNGEEGSREKAMGPWKKISATLEKGEGLPEAIEEMILVGADACQYNCERGCGGSIISATNEEATFQSEGGVKVTLKRKEVTRTSSVWKNPKKEVEVEMSIDFGRDSYQLSRSIISDGLRYFKNDEDLWCTVKSLAIDIDCCQASEK